MSDVTVYSVSSGSYSDYGVLCLFTTEALALAYAAKLISLDEQTRLQELENQPQLKTTAEREEYHRLQAKADCFVESFQLWDSLPVAESSE